MTKPGANAIEVWQERLDHLLQEQAVLSDPAQRFTVKRQIKEAREMIRALQGNPRLAAVPDLGAGAGELPAGLGEVGAAEDLKPRPGAAVRKWLLGAAAVLVVALAVAGWWLWSIHRPWTWEELGVKPARASPAAVEHYRDGLEALAFLDNRGARASFEKALEAQPDFLLARSALAEALLRDGEPTRAGEVAVQVCETPGVRRLPTWERQLVEARCHRVWGEWEAAIRDYLELRQEFQQTVEYVLSAAEAQKGAGRPREAADALEAAGKVSRDPRFELTLAQAAFELGEFERSSQAAERALQKAGRGRAERRRAKALLLRGVARWQLGKLTVALADCREAHALYAQVDDTKGQREALDAMGGVLREQGQLAEAKVRYEASLAYKKGDRVATARTHLNLAGIEMEQGALFQAQQTYGTVLAIYRELGKRREEGEALGNLGAVLFLQGSLAEALARFDEALVIAREQDSRAEEMNQQINRALVRSLRLELTAASRALDEAEELAKRMSFPSGRAAVAMQRGRLALLGGNLREARQRLETALAQQLELEDTPAVARTRKILARVALEDGRFPEAEALAQEARKVFAGSGLFDEQALSDALLAWARLERWGPGVAQEAFGQAQQRAAVSENFELRTVVTLLAVRLLAAGGRPAEGVSQLEALLATARARGHAVLEMDVRLLQGELELGTGKDLTAARARLAALKREARDRRYGLVADKAARRLQGKGP